MECFSGDRMRQEKWVLLIKFRCHAWALSMTYVLANIFDWHFFRKPSICAEARNDMEPLCEQGATMKKIDTNPNNWIKCGIEFLLLAASLKKKVELILIWRLWKVWNISNDNCNHSDPGRWVFTQLPFFFYSKSHGNLAATGSAIYERMYGSAKGTVRIFSLTIRCRYIIEMIWIQFYFIQLIPCNLQWRWNRIAVAKVATDKYN